VLYCLYFFMFFVIMTCRLFIDEVGNDDTRSVSERYLSLTGIITKTHGHDRRITPAIEALKAKFFGHDPPRKVVVLHRREIFGESLHLIASGMMTPTLNGRTPLSA
jgi:hypothetical protein